LIGLLKSIFERYDVEEWKKCFVVVSETKIRIQRKLAFTILHEGNS